MVLIRTCCNTNGLYPSRCLSTSRSGLARYITCFALHDDYLFDARMTSMNTSYQSSRNPVVNMHGSVLVVQDYYGESEAGSAKHQLQLLPPVRSWSAPQRNNLLTRCSHRQRDSAAYMLQTTSILLDHIAAFITNVSIAVPSLHCDVRSACPA